MRLCPTYPFTFAKTGSGLAIWRELGDPIGIAKELIALGNVANAQGDELTARSLYEQSLAIKRELGDQRGIAVVLNNLAMMAY